MSIFSCVTYKDVTHRSSPVYGTAVRSTSAAAVKAARDCAAMGFTIITTTARSAPPMATATSPRLFSLSNCCIAGHYVVTNRFSASRGRRALWRRVRGGRADKRDARQQIMRFGRSGCATRLQEHCPRYQPQSVPALAPALTAHAAAKRSRLRPAWEGARSHPRYGVACVRHLILQAPTRRCRAVERQDGGPY